MTYSRAATSSLLFVLGLLAPSLASAGEEIFSEDFEAGDACGWTTLATSCETKAAFADSLELDLDGLEISVCIAKSQGSSTGVNYTLCGEELCADGVTEGCTVVAHVSNVVVDAVDLDGSADLAFDDDSLDLAVSFQLGGTDNCDVLVTNGAGTATTSITLGALCATSLQEVETVEALVDGDATLAVANCSSAAILGFVVDLVKPSVIAQVESIVSDRIETEILALSGDRAICP